MVNEKHGDNPLTDLTIHGQHVKTTTVETAERGRSPLGAYVRYLMDGRTET